MDGAAALVMLKSTFLHVEVGSSEDEDSPLCASRGSRSRAASQPIVRRRCGDDGDEHPVGLPGSLCGLLYVDDGSGAGWQKVSPPPSPEIPVCVPAQDRAAARRGAWRSVSDLSTASSDEGSEEPQQIGGAMAMGKAKTEPASRARLPIDPATSWWTTVMMRNLPTSYSRDDLCRLVDGEGFSARYDFLYLPTDFKTGNNEGFAFVNLVSPADAQEFREHFNRFRRWGVPSQKLCNVSWAKPNQQGLEANIERYRNSSVMHRYVAEACKPMLLHRGVQVEFPRSTRKVWPPSASFGTRANRGRQ